MMGIRDERLSQAAKMPNRAFAGADCLDVRLECELGRIFFSDLISLAEYEAGIRYGNIVLSYLKTTDAPDPYGNDYIANISDDECLRRKINMASVKLLLSGLDRRCGRILDRVIVYDEQLRAGELSLLRHGLKVLAGIEPRVAPGRLSEKAGVCRSDEIAA